MSEDSQSLITVASKNNNKESISEFTGLLRSTSFMPVIGFKGRFNDALSSGEAEPVGLQGEQRPELKLSLLADFDFLIGGKGDPLLDDSCDTV